MSYNNDDFENWVDLWDQACKNKIFPTQHKEDERADYIAQRLGHDTPDEVERTGDPYFDYLDSTLEDEGLLQESKTPKKVSANPIYPDSVGKDSDHPAAVWVSEKIVEEIVDLKKKLYEIECKMNAEEAGGKKWTEKVYDSDDKKLMTQIDSVRKKIDSLSNLLGLKDEPTSSTWAVKD